MLDGFNSNYLIQLSIFGLLAEFLLFGWKTNTIQKTHHTLSSDWSWYLIFNLLNNIGNRLSL